MGGSKGQTSTSNTSGSSTQTREVSPEERELMNMDLALRRKTDSALGDMQLQGLSLGTQLLSGNTPLPGWMSGMEQGLSENAINDIANQSLRDVDYKMAGQGIMDSGTRASVLARTSGDVRRAAYEFNIGNKQNLLNLALTGQAQIQQPVLGFSSSLGNRMTTMGSQTRSSTGTQSTFQPSRGWGFSF